MVPNIDGTLGHKIETRKKSNKYNTVCFQYPTNRNPAQSLHENAITVQRGDKMSERHRKR